MTPGVYRGLPMAEYLAIEALSATPLRTVIEECPRAGWWKSHLNPAREREVSQAMDVGSAAHSVLLEDSWDCVVEIDPALYPAKTKPFNIPKGFTNDAIKEARDAARAAGKYPVLLGGTGEIRNMVTVAREFIDSLRETEPAVWRAFQPDGGESEVTMVWEDDGLLCKLRTDRLATDCSLVIDYKTTATSVEPDRWGRTQMTTLGHDFGAAWYRRGIAALSGTVPAYVYLCQEVEAPHLCSLIGVNPERAALGDDKVATALATWRRCLRTDKWDSYPNKVCYPELPPWESTRWQERDIDRAFTTDAYERGLASQP
jgi:hypothetical protein